jgi:hypothetical protein
LPIADCSLQIANCGLQIADWAGRENIPAGFFVSTPEPELRGDELNHGDHDDHNDHEVLICIVNLVTVVIVVIVVKCPLGSVT